MLQESDSQAAYFENLMLVTGLYAISSRTQRWVNPIQSEMLANQKPFQLFIASKVGFNVPPTIMSNCSSRIFDFFDKFSNSLIFKPFNPINWFGQSGERVQFANVVEKQDIFGRVSQIEANAQMFQVPVEKQYELRVIALGSELIAVRLNSQHDERTQVDWRKGNGSDLSPELLAKLPDHVVYSLNKYMEMMGLEYGAFDFIVDKEDRFHFLECNIAGQFLFF